MNASATTIAYASPFVPPEWIAAHGFAPVRVVPHAAREARFNGQGVCYYCHSLAEELCRSTDFAGVVLTTTCDQMRRMAERFADECPTPVFLFNMPATWRSESSGALYRAELQRLGNFLVELGGHHPTPSEPIVRLVVQGDAARMPCATNAATGIPLALIGGPELWEHERILDCIRQAGGYVAIDGRTGAERTCPKAVDRDLANRDPLAALVDAYFEHIPDAFRRPNDRLFDWIDNSVRMRSVRGAIVGHYVWCDLWRAEAYRIKERLSVPCLIIDYDESPEVSERTSGRIHAFLETLQ